MKKRKMKKLFNVFIIIALVGILIFSSGQEGCGEDEEPAFSSLGLSMEFVSNAPPSEVNHGQQFPIYVDITNQGGYDIETARANFYLTGIGENLAGVTTTLSNKALLNKKTTQQVGGSERLKFAESATSNVQLQNPFTFNVQLDSCYSYATIVESSICVGESNEVCSIEGNKIDSGTNTAAPIQITSLTEKIEGNKVYFYFTVSNEGGGEVYLPDADCEKLQENDIDEKTKENMVEIVIRTEQGFSCKLQQTTEPYTSIDALEGAAKLGKITCVKTLENEDTHLSPIEFILTYKYREHLIKSLTILPA